MMVTSLGSSPRMRGTQMIKCGAERISGIIPAYAGNTTLTGSPRSTCKGSSPRMRGTPPLASIRLLEFGIIPAYAGNTCTVRHQWPEHGDHPRVCGEHTPESLPEGLKAGSSPRMRGTHFPYLRDEFTGGIIPAYAGNTNCLPHCSKIVGDHPRVCGEHTCAEVDGADRTGSSPRMRGTRHVEARTGFRIGIIPAYAGNTIWLTRAPNTAKDHPRVCGEHDGADRTLSTSTGSSPRMRGTQRAQMVSNRRTGIIPAYAGNTCG